MDFSQLPPWLGDIINKSHNISLDPPSVSAHEGHTHFVNGQPIDDTSPLPPAQPKISMWSPNQTNIWQSNYPDQIKGSLLDLGNTLDKLPQANILPANWDIPSQAQRKEDFMTGLVKLLGMNPNQPSPLAPIANPINQAITPFRRVGKALLGLPPEQDAPPPALPPQSLAFNGNTVVENSFTPQALAAISPEEVARYEQDPRIQAMIGHSLAASDNEGARQLLFHYLADKTGRKLDTKQFYQDVNALQKTNFKLYTHAAHLASHSLDLSPEDRAQAIWGHLGADFGPNILKSPLGKYYTGLIDPNGHLDNWAASIAGQITNNNRQIAPDFYTQWPIDMVKGQITPQQADALARTQAFQAENDKREAVAKAAREAELAREE